MLHDKVIVYDDSCPMCRLYTYWFVAWGFLRAENRIGFANAPDEVMNHLDLDRGRHEIPLFDRKSKETVYGLRALMSVLESKWTMLKPLFRCRVFYWMLFPVYQVITYNRRVIAGCGTTCGFDCAPDLSRFYRSLYLGLVGTVVSVIGCSLLMIDETIPAVSVGVLCAFAITMTILGVLGGIGQRSADRWDIAGHSASTMLIVSLLLSPLIVVASRVPIPLSVGILANAVLLGITEMRRRHLA